MKFLSFALILLALYSCVAEDKGNAHVGHVLPEGDDVPASYLVDSNLAPIWGYRFVVAGDFNGDGKQDTLTEHFVSGLDGKETNKYYNTDNYDTLVALTGEKQPRSFMVPSTPEIDTLPIAEHLQLLGAAFVKNEGDLDGNGTDEVSFVVEWADWSSINSCHVVTWTKVGWKELLVFGIHDWELPSLPQAGITYGMFGADGMQTYPAEDRLNDSLEDALHSFGLIEKVENGTVRIQTYAEEDSDSVAIGEPTVRTVRLTTIAKARSVSR